MKASQLLTVMAGHCPGPNIPRSTQLWVEELQRHSRHLVLVFDNPPPERLPASWQNSTIHVLFEKHGAYDFGSYRRGLEVAQEQGLLNQASHVLFCNDSVLGPLGDLAPVLARMQAEPDQAWGLTASHQLTPHLQSFFVLLARPLLEHTALQQFFQSIEPQASRHAVIERYELGLSRALLAAGCKLHAWVQPQQLRDPRSGRPAGNPTAYPLSLVELGVPLIKARALREASANEEGIAATCRLIAERNPELWKAIWQESPRQRQWQQLQRIGVLLHTSDHIELDARLHWLEQQPHPGVKLLLPVPGQQRQQLAQLRHRHAAAIGNDRLQLLELHQGGLAEAVMLSQADWLVGWQPALERAALALQLQARQLAASPTLHSSLGPPQLWSRRWLLNQPPEVVHRLLAITA